MAAFNFPNSPSTNDLHTENNVTFKWNGTIWNRVGDVGTTLTQLNVTGVSTFAGAVNIAGLLTYEDVKNVDSVGIVTARTGIHIDDSITHIGDTNTKIRFPEADNFTVECAGAERFRVKPTNDVAVFTGSNSGTLTIRNDTSNEMQLHTGGSDALIFGTGGENERLRINSSGQVLIGTTTNPAYTNRRLTVATTSGTTAIEVRSATNGDGRIYFTDNTTSGNVGAYAGKVLYDHTDNYMAFHTGGDDDTPAERLRIKSDGDIVATGNLKTNNVTGKNLVINGSFRVDQRNNGAEVTASSNSIFCADRWTVNNDGHNYFKLQRKDDAPAQTIGTYYYMRATCIQNYGGFGGSSASQIIENNLEGYTVAHLNYGLSNAKQCTLSFWFRCSLTGSFGGSLANSGYDRCHPFIFTYSSANTWQYVTYTFSTTGFTTGGFQTGTGVGLRLVFSLGNGTGRQASPGQWHNSVYFGPTGETALVNTNGATMDWASVQLEEGTLSTRFEHRSYGEELRLCERYYQILMKEGNGFARTGGLGGTPYSNGNQVYCPCIFPVEMRAKPTIISSGSGTFRSRLGNNNGFNGFSGANDHNRKSATFITSGLSSGNIGQYHWIETNGSSSLLALSSEL